MTTTVICNDGENENNSTNLIVGGFKVKIEEVPYQAAVLKKGHAICGGTIIGPRWILTSLHCLDYPEIAEFNVVVGTEEPESGSMLKIEETVTMPYSMEMNYDLALLKLTEPVQYSAKVQCLPLLESKSSLVPGKPAYISGFGVNGEHSHETGLKAATVNMLPPEKCADVYPEEYRNFMICAGFEQGQVDSCQGDSGGPLVLDGKLAGIVFFGHGCARPNYPGLYISVPSFYDWITSVVKNMSSPGEEPLC
ncbi:trypsin 3A1-like [Anopheles nili]|uniref:trypsin 3A1-like n=1 Tax=Anopheles nili TaxID=185578 RepID=UPI00237A961B|nr:trypsin 3A1-like [Anopheles nili]